MPRPRKNNSLLPSTEREERARADGCLVVAGVDEAGRGPLAGPVVAAAAILPDGFINFGIRDSKLVPEHEREMLYERMLSAGVLFGVGMVNHRDIDRLNIYKATQVAMAKAIARLPVKPEMILIDGMKLPGLDVPQEKIIHGDRIVLSIAAASIAAKVTRDRVMRRIEELCPGWGFGRHKGYPVPDHLRALDEKGLCPFHRRTFGPVAAAIGSGR
jgi:ribonuclease HII